jgi:FMN reductase
MSPLIVGIGGTLRPDSTCEKALRFALEAAARIGASTELLSGRMLDLPNYDPSDSNRPLAARRIVKLVREADGLIIATPAYHGGPSGLVKNVLDYLEDLSGDRRPYLDGRAVGIIVAANGLQAMGTTLTSTRSVVHSLRGWPTPMAVAFNSSEKPFDDLGVPNAALASQLELVSRQVVEFAEWQIGRRADQGRKQTIAMQP